MFMFKPQTFVQGLKGKTAAEMRNAVSALSFHDHVAVESHIERFAGSFPEVRFSTVKKGARLLHKPQEMTWYNAQKVPAWTDVWLLSELPGEGDAQSRARALTEATGFLVYRVDAGYALAVNGAGYSFATHHFLPLMVLLGSAD